MDFLETLREANIQRDKHWNPDDKIDLAFRGLELGGEVGELQNMVKKMIRERIGLRGSKVTPEQVLLEVGDVAICLDLLAMDLGFSLQAAIRAAFNKTSTERDLPVFL